MQYVLKIPLDLLDEFPSFPFRVKRDSEFLNLLASIKGHYNKDRKVVKIQNRRLHT